MEFGEFKESMQKHIDKMLKDQDYLFQIDVDKDEFWSLYLDSFPPGTNEIFRERREYDCSCCRQFIKSFGNVAVIKNNKIQTIWDFKIDSKKYQVVIDALSKYLKTRAIKDYLVTKERNYGSKPNHEMINGKVHTWEHFYYQLPKKFVEFGDDTIDTIKGRHRDIRNVFQRSLEEITQDSIETILELIQQKSLYKGDEWREVLSKFLNLHKEYSKLKNEQKDNYCWIRSREVGAVIGKIRNHSIGVLLQDISNGMDLNEAVKRYEKIVAPTNYKRPKAIFTKKMVEQAQNKIEELGLMDSLGRRYATIEDITVNNILYANKDFAKVIGDVFDDLKKDVSINPKKFDKVEEIQIEHFVRNILPTTTKLEIMFENKHAPNLFSLIAPVNKGSKTMFKWNNNFSWAYNGNITDSMKERVKQLGGNIDCALRFSIQWNENGNNNNDFDAHCIEPNGSHIYFERMRSQTGSLDVDIINPIADHNNKVAIENIAITKIQIGEYKFWVHNYTYRGGREGFRAEIEYNGQIYKYEYNKELRHKEDVQVARIKIDRKNKMNFVESLPTTKSSREIWGIKTNQFHPVSVCMLSPNYWDEQKGIGHKHYFFVINNCVNEDQPNGFFNEFLKEEFMEHKRVFEALGSKMKVEKSANQLSGLGFSATKRNSLICKVDGSFSRVIKFIF